ncbi:MAG: hypothetical protein HGA33_00270 [Candidatus Moranbacteria bacterium]|nr:hypothetical protein [Candidatus Moranbacteria bacterium]
MRQTDAVPLGTIRGALRCLLARQSVAEGSWTLTAQKPVETDMVLRFSVVVSGHSVVYPVYLVPKNGTFVAPELHADLVRSIQERDRAGGHRCRGGSGGSKQSCLIFVERKDASDSIAQFDRGWDVDQLLVRRFLLRLFLWWPRDENVSKTDIDVLKWVDHKQVVGKLKAMTGKSNVSSLVRWLYETGLVKVVEHPKSGAIERHRISVDDVTRRICADTRHEPCAACVRLAL